MTRELARHLEPITSTRSQGKSNAPRDFGESNAGEAEEGRFATALLVIGGATGALLQVLSFALILAQQGSGLAVLASTGAALSSLTLVGFALHVTARSRAAALAAPRPEAEPAHPTLSGAEPELGATAQSAMPSVLPVADSDEPRADTTSGILEIGNKLRPAQLDDLAHDINDLATVIVTHSELLCERHHGQKASEVEPILDAAGRLSGVARRLVAFAERQRSEPIANAGGGSPLGQSTASARRDSEPVYSERRVIGSSEHRGVVLLVEDEEVLLKTTRRMLEHRGYRVLAATDGARALDLALEVTKLDVLVTDLSLPGIDGKELARRLRWSRPKLPVLFTSGYDAVTSGLTLAEGGLEAFLPKPFTPRELDERLSELCGPAAREASAQRG